MAATAAALAALTASLAGHGGAIPSWFGLVALTVILILILWFIYRLFWG